ncbi:unnamed protein product [Acanthoscelides obtectus]|uniref:RNA methyltransferase n=1 Tax=Acanthoscelides obtectus TaxID=200917 RepID=A0A9P0PRT3_ACAOB|nr:unnamed protein product [Acanthoscelides obtectus]CAK1663095.1 Probable RNA methyltransferase CG11342 [Acanthoscelides obtectus]
MTEHLQFKDSNPGAVKYGNFINYYQFHPPEERIGLLPKDIWVQNSNDFLALDIGCNSGDLTFALWKFLKSAVMQDVFFLAVDIDPVLIERAKEANKDNRICFHCLDIVDETNRNHVINNYLQLKNAVQFDAVFCFSTTMWIHLNHGDIGLKVFLSYISKLGKLLVIEPQPWKCYKSALKRVKDKTIFPYFQTLKIRGNIESEIEKYLVEEIGLVKVFDSERTNWDRKIMIFK